MLTFTICLFLISNVFSQEQQHNNAANPTKKIKNVAVDVYYESLCPYARAFITKQLHPTLATDLGNYINLTLHPYGKATNKFEEGNVTFVCHHGPNECTGNKYHACGLYLINDGQPTKGLGYNNDAMNYVNCLADTVSNENIVQYKACAKDAKDFADPIEDCVNNGRGDELLADYGRTTEEFEKPLLNVPSITFNRRKSQGAEQDFRRELCKEFGDEKPTECDKIGNTPQINGKGASLQKSNSAFSTKATLGVLTIIVAIFLI